MPKNLTLYVQLFAVKEYEMRQKNKLAMEKSD